MAVVGPVGAAVAMVGCGGAGKAPPFEWWVDPLPAPPRAKPLAGPARIGVLVAHTGGRDDFKAFQRTMRGQHDRVKRGELPGFRAECHYLPKLAEEVRRELESGLGAGGRFMVVERRAVDKALKRIGYPWLDLRVPAKAAAVGRGCGSDLMLLVEITDCVMKVTEARRQTIGTQQVGPARRTDVWIAYEIRMVDVAGGEVVWQSKLDRRAGYKLEGPGSMGHWYKRRDPLEFREALRGQSITEYVLRAFVGTAGGAGEAAPVRGGVNRGEPWRWH